MNNNGMKKLRARHIVVGALFFAGIASAQSVSDDRAALSKAKAQSILAEQRAARLEASAEAELSDAEAAKQRAAAVAARIQGAEAEIAAAETRIRLIQKLQGEQQARLAAKQEPAARLAAALQTLGRRPPALAFTQPGSITDLVHVRAVLASITPVLRQRTADLRAEIEGSKRLKTNAELAVKALASSKQKLADQREALTQLAALHRGRSQEIQGSAMAEQDRAMALGEQARDITELLGRLDEVSAVRNRLAALPPPLPRPAQPNRASEANDTGDKAGVQSIPYRLPVAGTLVTGLGEVSEAGVRARGMTLATRPDAQIVAPSAGRIAFAGPYRGYGNIVIIDHGSGWTSLITQVSVLDVRTADNVVQGSPLGKAGKERPTVTVELRQGSKPVDIGSIVG